MRTRATLIKFAIFAVVMAMLTAFLFFIFGQYRTGATNGYSAVFTDVSRLKPGQSVRVAGIRVGTVNSVSLQPDKKVVVKFDADRNIVLTEGTRAAVRYLNLVGDRYLELVDGPGSPKRLPAGGQIPVSRTAPALDLDLLLGGLKPVTQGLNARDVNALTSGLLQVFQGQGGTLDSLFTKATSFSNALADNDQTVQQLIDNLNIVIGTISKDGKQ
ncbi:MCE family protein, partial [Mycobacterium avium]